MFSVRAPLRLLGSLLLLLPGPLARAQQPVRLWDARFGSRGYDFLACLVATTDGGYLAAGTTSSPDGGDVSQPVRGREHIEPFGPTGYHIKAQHDFWVVKTDSLGRKLWDARFGGSYYEQLAAALPLPDGAYLLAGTTRSAAGADVSQPAFPGARGNADYWIIKTDALGRKLWDARFGGPQNEELTNARLTPDGGVLLIGTTTSGAGHAISGPASGPQDYWLLKLDAAGQQQWDARVGRRGAACSLTDALPLPEGGYLLAGIAAPTSPPPPAADTTLRCLLARLDAAGRPRWTTTVALGSRYLQADPYSITVDTTGRGFRVAGYYTDGREGHHAAARWQFPLDAEGRAGQVRFSSDARLRRYDIVFRRPAPDGGYLLGYFGRHNPANADFVVEKYNRRGRRQWRTVQGGPDDELLTSVLPTADGGYLLGGSSESGAGGRGPTQPERGQSDFWLVKLGPAARRP